MISTVDHPGAPVSSREPTGGWRTFPPGLRLYVGMILAISAMTALALVYYHFTTRMEQAQLWTPQSDNFGDFWHYQKLFKLIHTPAFFQSADRFAYPAPCALFYQVLYHTGPRPHLVFDLILMLIFCISGFVFFRVLQRFGMRRRDAASLTALLMLTSYPWHALYDRGNLELFVYVFLAGGLWAFLTGRKSLAAVLWGCAGAMKIYPLAMLAIFLHRRTLRPLLIGIATFVAVLLVSFWYVGPTIRVAAMGSLDGVFGFLGTYAAAARRPELNADHSVLGSIKEILTLHMFGLDRQWPNLSKAYQAIVIVGGSVLFFGWVRKLPVLNQVCLLLIAIVLLPPVSYDYTLIHTYLVMGIVLGAYFYALRNGRPFPGAKAYFAAFALIATPQVWMLIRGLRVNGLIKCAALLTISWLLLRFPLTMGLKAERMESA